MDIVKINLTNSAQITLRLANIMLLGQVLSFCDIVTLTLTLALWVNKKLVILAHSKEHLHVDKMSIQIYKYIKDM